GCDEDVLEYGHVGERARHLVSPPDAEPAPGGRVQTRDGLVSEGDDARVGGQIAGDEAEQAGLARSVRPHDPDGVPGPDGQAEVFRDDDLAEALRHVVELENGTSHAYRVPCLPCSGLRRRWASGRR